MKLTTPQPKRCQKPTVKAQKLAYLLFELPDLDIAEKFLCDFGLTTAFRDEKHLYMRSAGPEPFCYRATKAEKETFIGFGFMVGGIEDLEGLAKVSGASGIQKSGYIGGGHCVRLTDPSGFIVEAVCDQEVVVPLQHRSALPLNYELKTPRVNDTQRPPVNTPEVLKLGHTVLEVADYQETCAWYTQHFGLIPSDVQVLSDGSPVVVFLRLDLGSTPADHHTMAIAQGFMPSYSHSAYELVDADAVGMGQRILRERGWKHSWGIGRHILGSQIFDYWQDPWGHKLEHYCDGDVFTDDLPMGVHPVSREAMSQWGQVMPTSFTKPKISFSMIRALVKNVRRSPDLSVRKLITLAKIFG